MSHQIGSVNAVFVLNFYQMIVFNDQSYDVFSGLAHVKNIRQPYFIEMLQ